MHLLAIARKKSSMHGHESFKTTVLYLSSNAACFRSTKRRQALLYKMNQIHKYSCIMLIVQIAAALVTCWSYFLVNDLDFREVMPDDASLRRNMQRCMTNVHVLCLAVVLQWYWTFLASCTWFLLLCEIQPVAVNSKHVLPCTNKQTSLLILT